MGSLAYDRAAQLFTALIRYPDFMANYMGKEATCHPSANIGLLLAAAQFAGATTSDSFSRWPFTTTNYSYIGLLETGDMVFYLLGHFQKIIYSIN